MQQTVLNFVDMLFTVYIFMIFGYVLMSWLPNLRESPIGEVLGKLVEPVLSPFRKIIPPLGMIDLSPIVAILVINWFAREGALFLVRLLIPA